MTEIACWEDVLAGDVAGDWLAKLERALDARDLDAVDELFLADVSGGATCSR